MTATRRIEVPIRGMDCAECCAHVQKAIAGLPGVRTVDVFLATEKAVVECDAPGVDLPAIRHAVAAAGYQGPEPEGSGASAKREKTGRFGAGFTRSVMMFIGMVFGAVLFVVVVGEWMGLFATVTERIPWGVGLLIVLIGWYPVLRNVIQAALRRQVLSHTLMSVGVLAALAVGEWTTAAIVVFFYAIGDYVEQFTAECVRVCG